MRSGGQTTVIQRILERRAQKPPEIQEDTSATVAVMLRVLPPPRGLLVIEDEALLDRLENMVAADLPDCDRLSGEQSAVTLLQEQFFPVIITDSTEMIRKIRARQSDRVPYVLYVSELDEGSDRELGLLAGADDCVGRRASDREIHARVGTARRIAELEAVLRIALAENRKLSTTDDLTRVASRRFFTKHFPREVDRAARYARPLSLILCRSTLYDRIKQGRLKVSKDGRRTFVTATNFASLFRPRIRTSSPILKALRGSLWRRWGETSRRRSIGSRLSTGIPTTRTSISC